MADALKLKTKILKILKIFPIEEIKSKNNDVKFALKITPFGKIKNLIVIIEYYNKVDMIRVVSSIATGKTLTENFKTKNENEKNEIIAIFSKNMRARNFSPVIANDFAILEGYKLLFQQNMSAQGLFDTVTEGIFLLQDLAELLYQADQSLKVPKVSETSKNMFQ